jgi:predicted glycoside hydrolase/deacetylase ChbG (UPF0249 family)
MVLRLVITADDLGIDEARDRGIFEAFAAGALRQASLLVRGASAHSAAARARASGLPLGLHLDLTELEAVAEKTRIRSLLDAGGRKLGKHGLRAAVARGDVQPEHVERETSAQLDAFEELCGTPALHVDGHQHVQVVPGLSESIARVLGRRGVKTTRIPEQSNPRALDSTRAAFHAEVAQQARAARAIYAAHGVGSSDRFSGLQLMGHAMSEHALRSVVEACRDASLEVMTHPGYASQRGDAFNRSVEREHELRVLCARPLQPEIERGELRIASFADLWLKHG